MAGKEEDERKRGYKAKETETEQAIAYIRWTDFYAQKRRFF